MVLLPVTETILRKLSSYTAMNVAMLSGDFTVYNIAHMVNGNDI